MTEHIEEARLDELIELMSRAFINPGPPVLRDELRDFLRSVREPHRQQLAPYRQYCPHRSIQGRYGWGVN